jgi:hypothetical protein
MEATTITQFTQVEMETHRFVQTVNFWETSTTTTVTTAVNGSVVESEIPRTSIEFDSNLTVNYELVVSENIVRFAVNYKASMGFVWLSWGASVTSR